MKNSIPKAFALPVSQYRPTAKRAAIAAAAMAAAAIAARLAVGWTLEVGRNTVPRVDFFISFLLRLNGVQVKKFIGPAPQRSP